MNYAEIIGNGTADNKRSNARVLDWDGNERLKGNLYVGCNTNSSGGSKVLSTADKGIATGVASLNASGKVPYEQISPTVYKFTETISANSTSDTVIDIDVRIPQL